MRNRLYAKKKGERVTQKFDSKKFFKHKLLIYFIKKYLTNKVTIFIALRYAVYFLQFFAMIWSAKQMGPELFSEYSQILLILNTFIILNFGIPNGVTSIVANNTSTNMPYTDVIQSGIILTLISSLALFFFFYFLCYFNVFSINSSKYFFQLSLIIFLNSVNQYFINIKRLSGEYVVIIFNQFSLPFSIILAIMVSKKNELIENIIIFQAVTGIISMIMFVWSHKNMLFLFEIKLLKKILKVSLNLFVYNTFFYLIFIISRYAVDVSFSKIFFANFSLAFTIVSACVLIFDVVFFVLTPKFIRRNAISHNFDESERINYEFKVLIHFLLYISMIFVHFSAQYFSDFTEVSRLYQYLILVYAISYLSFGSSEILLSRNEERFLAQTSLLVFCFHALCIVVIIVFNLSFNYFIYNLWLTLFLFFMAITSKVNRLNKNSKKTIGEIIHKNINLLIPLILMLVVVTFNFNIIWVLLIIIGFFFLNVKHMVSFSKRLLNFIGNESKIEIL